MRITFLGTAAVGGVPLFGCQCSACRAARENTDLTREPCSALIEYENTKILLDAGLMDLHRRFAPGELDAIVLTHFHADHVQGLLHLRWGKGPKIPVFIPPDPDGCADLFRHPGILDFRPKVAFSAFDIGPFKVTPLPLFHSKPTFGYAFEGRYGATFAYLTDTRGLPTDTETFLRETQPDGLAIDCTFPPSDAPKGHNDWTRALACIEATAPKRSWLTHISHDLDNWRLNSSPELREGISIAADGDQFELLTSPGRRNNE